MKKDVELKPCPFCGGEVCMERRDYAPREINSVLSTEAQTDYWVACSCGVGTGLYKRAADAAAIWNRRTPYEEEARDEGRRQDVALDGAARACLTGSVMLVAASAATSINEFPSARCGRDNKQER